MRFATLGGMHSIGNLDWHPLVGGRINWELTTERERLSPHIIERKNQMNKLQQEYYKKYEALINQIVLSGKMTFFNKADLLELMEQDLHEKIKQLKVLILLVD